MVILEFAVSVVALLAICARAFVLPETGTLTNAREVRVISEDQLVTLQTKINRLGCNYEAVGGGGSAAYWHYGNEKKLAEDVAAAMVSGQKVLASRLSYKEVVKHDDYEKEVERVVNHDMPIESDASKVEDIDRTYLIVISNGDNCPETKSIDLSTQAAVTEVIKQCAGKSTVAVGLIRIGSIFPSFNHLSGQEDHQVKAIYETSCLQKIASYLKKHVTPGSTAEFKTVMKQQEQQFDQLVAQKMKAMEATPKWEVVSVVQDPDSEDNKRYRYDKDGNVVGYYITKKVENTRSNESGNSEDGSRNNHRSKITEIHEVQEYVPLTNPNSGQNRSAVNLSAIKTPRTPGITEEFRAEANRHWEQMQEENRKFFDSSFKRGEGNKNSGGVNARRARNKTKGNRRKKFRGRFQK